MWEVTGGKEMQTVKLVFSQGETVHAVSQLLKILRLSECEFSDLNGGFL